MKTFIDYSKYVRFAHKTITDNTDKFPKSEILLPDYEMPRIKCLYRSLIEFIEMLFVNGHLKRQKGEYAYTFTSGTYKYSNYINPNGEGKYAKFHKLLYLRSNTAIKKKLSSLMFNEIRKVNNNEDPDRNVLIIRKEFLDSIKTNTIKRS